MNARLNRIPRLPAGHNSRWPSTMFVGETPSHYRADARPCPPCTGECETLGRQCPPPAKLGPVAAIAVWSLAALMLVVVAAVVAGSAYVLTGAVIWALDAAAVSLLTGMGVL